ncbi:acetamidase/formamidase family protein [Actinocorallia sp. API 0066]|uniref:acetamidase/formamidase family protein n=1 Tax=Actinocorallia sp. API 0066 TaxID=2896846 RepID=UPI001E54CF4E|nr:acetamidase/formamidase family protein [Actinocorallia sp. API 0066]MCD0448364.1 acetamidase/formamidase family protein [Actinocorallia sp. API 0066]
MPLLSYGAQAVPGHTRWHPEIPAVAEVISGGSVRMECRGFWGAREALLCGPIAVVGAEPGDVIVVDVLGIGRADGGPALDAHPGVLGCAPGDDALPVEVEPDGPLLGRVRPGLADYQPVAARALRSAALAGQIVGSCADARLTAGSRIVLPVHVRGAKLSAGDLHFGDGCTTLDGWIDLRVNLTKRGVERFHVTGPLLMPA